MSLRNVNVGVASRFEVEGSSTLSQVAFISAIPKYEDTGSTQSNIGCVEGGKQVYAPSPNTSSIESLTVTFVSSDNVKKVRQWHAECNSKDERNLEKEDISVIGYDAKDNEVECYRIKDCYPEHLELGEFNAQSKEARVHSLRLKGSDIQDD